MTNAIDFPTAIHQALTARQDEQGRRPSREGYRGPHGIDPGPRAWDALQRILDNEGIRRTVAAARRGPRALDRHLAEEYAFPRRRAGAVRGAIRALVRGDDGAVLRAIRYLK